MPSVTMRPCNFFPFQPSSDRQGVWTMTTRARRALIPRLLPVLVMCAITSVTFARPRYVRGQVVPAAGATPQQDVITVNGTAQVKGKPTEVEIGALVSGEAELTNDAMVK